jgi:hypothetical protein
MTKNELQARSRRFSPLIESLIALTVVSQLAFIGFGYQFEASAKVEAEQLRVEQAKLTTSSYLAPPVTVSPPTTVAR